MKRTQSITLKQLANRLDLSQTTVSRALNGYSDVSESTRQRVITAANTLNYRPNPIATRLATGRSRAIGHVIPLSIEHEMINPIFTEFLAGAGEVYSKNDYHLVLTLVRTNDIETAYQNMAEQGLVDGIIVQGPNVREPRIGMLKKIGLPFVVHGRASTEDTDYSWLDVNNLRAFRQATCMLLETGHRRIGLINGLERMDFAYRRRIGYEDALRSFGIDVDPELIRSDEMTEQNGHDMLFEIMQQPDPPTAFLVSSIPMAIGAKRAVEGMNLKLGKDISLIIHDDELSYFSNSGSYPIFTAMRSSIRMAGRRCAEILLDLVNDPEHPHVQELLEVTFVPGLSTEPVISKNIQIDTE